MDGTQYLRDADTAELRAVTDFDRLAVIERRARIAAWGCLVAALALASAAFVNLA